VVEAVCARAGDANTQKILATNNVFIPNPRLKIRCSSKKAARAAA
jgi:hypothetical protein